MCEDIAHQQIIKKMCEERNKRLEDTKKRYQSDENEIKTLETIHNFARIESRVHKKNLEKTLEKRLKTRLKVCEKT